MWETWGQCDKSCGGGSQQRKREHIKEAGNEGKPCDGEKNEMRICNENECRGNMILF